MTTPAGCPATVKRGKRAGQPCGHKTPDGLATCLAHASKEERKSRGFGGPQPNAGRPRLERPIEVAQRLIEENVAALLRPHFAILGYRVERIDGELTLVEAPELRPRVTATYQGDVTLSDIEDLAAQVEAAERLLDRVTGRPRQALEHTGKDGEALSFADLGALAVTPQEGTP